MNNDYSNILYALEILHMKDATLFEVYFIISKFCGCLRVKIHGMENGPREHLKVIYLWYDFTWADRPDRSFY